MLKTQFYSASAVESKYCGKRVSLIKTIFWRLFSLTLLLPLPMAYAGQSETAQDLTTLLRAARSVTVNKVTITDPAKFNVKKFIKKTKENYLRTSGKKLDESNVLLAQLLAAIKQVIIDAKAGKYAGKWSSGDYANKFLPDDLLEKKGFNLKNCPMEKAT